MAYRKAGETGPVMVLIHGNLTSSVHWQTLMEQLEEHCVVYGVDMRGFGDSSYYKAIDSIGDLAEDVFLFLEALELKDILLLGWSTGGAVALELAAHHSERIERLILLDSVSAGGYSMFQSPGNLPPMVEQIFATKGRVHQYMNLAFPYISGFTFNRKWTLRRGLDEMMYDRRKPEREEYNHYLEAALKQRNISDVFYAVSRHNLSKEANYFGMGTGAVENIKMPVLIIHGKRDQVVPLRDAFENKRLLGDRARLVLLDTGHSAMTDDMEGLVEVLTKELQEEQTEALA